MIYLLLEKGSMTAPQLAKHFEVSVRTIYRDIDILSSAGIPIYATQGKGESIKRLVEPLKLVFKNRDWFLYGYCWLREDYRMFKLSRIRNIEISSESFSRQVPSQIFGEIEQNNDEIVSLKLLFDKDLAFIVYDYFDSIVEREDGKLLVEASLPHNERLYSFILSFCDKVEVIEPEAIRIEVIEKIKNIQNKYIT